MNFRGFWWNKSYTTQLVLIVIILLAVSSINILLIMLGIAPYMTKDVVTRSTVVFFTFFSFGGALLISGYHLSTMFRRNRRRTDTSEKEIQVRNK